MRWIENSEDYSKGHCIHDVPTGCAVCAGLVRYEPPEPSEGKVRTRPDHSKDVERILADRNKPAPFVHRARPVPTSGREAMARIHSAGGYAPHKPPPGRTSLRPNVERFTLDEWERPETAADMAARLGIDL